MTRISEMTPLQVASPTGIYVPVEKTGSATNYRIDLAATMSVTPQMFAAVGDGVTDDHAALQSWLDWGGGLFLPAGEYYSSGDLILRKNVVIDGDGYGFDNRIVDSSATLGYDNQPGSRIRFAVGKGFKVQNQTLLTTAAAVVAAGGAVASATQQGARYSRISNIALIGAGTGAAVAGLYANTLIYLDNVHVYKFAGKGFDFSASAAVDDGNSEYGDASGSELSRCRSAYNGSHGYHFRGNDVNSCKLDVCYSFENGGWGFLDQSLLGIKHDTCLAAANTSGSYKCIGSVANSAYDDCYVETDSGKAPDLSSRCVVNGGYLADIARLYNVGTSGNPTISGAAGVTTNLVTLRDVQDEAATVSGKAIIYRGTNRGLVLQGAPDGGGTYDVTLVNKNGVIALGVNTGTLNTHCFGQITLDFSGILLNGASSFPGIIATQAYAYSDTVKGYVIAGYGSSYDACLANHSGTVAIRVPTGTTDAEVVGSATAASYKVGANQVVGARKTGWAVDTGTAKRTANATYSGTAEVGYTQATVQALMDAVRDLSQTVKALKDDMHSASGHGLIGT